MYIRLLIGTASATALAFTGHARASTHSQALSGTQPQVCPALINEAAIATSNPNERLNVPIPPNNVLDLTYVCYGGGTQSPEPPAIELINTVIQQQTPQATTQFDQLPQDRIEFRSPF